MRCRGRSGSAYPRALGSLGILTSCGGSGLYGIWLSRWEMMLSRPRFLSSLSATYHGAHPVSVAANMVSRAPATRR